MDTSKLQVDLALPVGDSTLPRPWSRHSRGSSAYTSQHPEESEASQKKAVAEAEQQRIRQENEKKRKFLFSVYGGEEALDDPKQAAELEKYLNAMKSKSQTKTWENDTDVFTKTANSHVNVNVKSVKSKKTGGEGILIPKVHVKFGDEESAGFFEKSDDEDLYEDFLVPTKTETEVENPTTATNATSASSASSENVNHPPTDQKVQSKSKFEKLSPDMIAESGRLFVRNLNFGILESDLEGLFGRFGPLSQVHIPIAKDTKRPIGIAYILFMLPDDALKAYSALDGTIFQGRLLHILPAKDQPSRSEENYNNSHNSSYKAQKEKDLKATSSSTHNWNSLFIRSDAVLDAIADRLGVPKSSIMNAHESDSLAARLAIAETHIIQDTKEYLESEGVFLDAFINASGVERSKNVFLVKNLPFEVEIDELRSLFAKFGALGRVILPPLTRSIALIEFLEANEAKTAFRALAYSKFHAAPLFLEWAPINSLTTRPAMGMNSYKQNQRQLDIPAPAQVDEEEPVGNTRNTLYIKNLSFKTEVSALRALFAPCGTIKSARIPTKPSPSNASVLLSLGFGFIEFANSEDVNRALDSMQGVQLDGHALILKKASGGVASDSASQQPTASKKRKGPTEEVDEKLKPSKLLIRNIPFEATEGELRTLIKSFTAALKRLRLPKKFDGSHRGFGFAEFTSHPEAKHVKETLAATHLYGRHLVIEWAKLDEIEGNND